MVVVELVETVLANPVLSARGVEVGSKVLERVEVLSNAGNELIEARVGFWARFEELQKLGELGATGRDERALPLREVVKIERSEPGVLDDLGEAIDEFGGAVLVGADARFRPGEEAGEEVDALLGEIGLGFSGNFQALSPAEDLAAGGDRILGVEGCVAHEAFVHDDSEGPPIHGAGVGISGRAILSGQDLGSDVIWSSDGGVGHLPSGLAGGELGLVRPDADVVLIVDGHGHGIAVSTVLATASTVQALGDVTGTTGRTGARSLHHTLPAKGLQHHLGVVARAHLADLLAQAQVGELEMAPGVQQHVIRLDVSVDISQSVDRRDGMGRLGHEESGRLLREGVLPHQERHEVAAGEVFHHHVQVRLVLEGVVQDRQPPVVLLRRGQDVPLGPDVSDLILHHHHLLLH